MHARRDVVVELVEHHMRHGIPRRVRPIRVRLRGDGVELLCQVRIQVQLLLRALLNKDVVAVQIVRVLVHRHQKLHQLLVVRFHHLRQDGGLVGVV